MQIFKKKENDAEEEITPFDENMTADEDEEEEEPEKEEEDINELSEIEDNIDKGEDVVISSLESQGVPKSRMVYTCPRCKKIYMKGKWVKDNISDIYTIRQVLAYCEKCLKKVYENYIGTVEIHSQFLAEQKESILELAEQVVHELEDAPPFEKIVRVQERGGVLYIYTNTTRLAQEIGRRIRLEYQGGIRYQWLERNQYLQVIWQDHVDNKNLLKERMKELRARRGALPED